MPDPRDASLTECGKLRKRVEQRMRYWGPLRGSMSKLKRFLAGERYVDDHGAYQLDRRLTQIRGQETQDTIRHLVGEATQRPRSLEPRPIDEETDDVWGEVATSLVEMELSNPWKGFDRLFYSAVVSARETRLGAVLVDWEPDVGKFGEILFRLGQRDRILWDEAYESPHHPLCPMFMEERRVDVEWARQAYKAPWLEPDRQAMQNGLWRSDRYPILNYDGRRMEPPDVRDDQCTLWVCWYKNVRTRKNKEKPADDRALDPGERYMVCLNGCGFRSPTQQAMQEDGYPGMELPEIVDGCPRCAANGINGKLERIDSLAQPYSELNYAYGNQLLIHAPFSTAPDDQPVYNGNWPIPQARSFPGVFLTCYVDPGQPVGPCDTDYMWDQQIAWDNLRTEAVQRVLEHRNYWALPRMGIFDSNGQRFMFRDDQRNVMFKDASVFQQWGKDAIEHLGTTGVDPGFSIVGQVIERALTQYRGTADLGTIEDQKGKSGVALQTQVAVGNIPTEDFNRRKNWEMSMFCGVVWDYERATMTPERLQRLRISGVDLVQGLQGDEMPNYDFVIEDTPSFSGLEKARADAWDSGVQVAMQTPELLEAWAKFHNVPRSVVRELQSALKLAAENHQRQMQEQQQAQMGGGIDVTGGTGAVPTTPPASPAPQFNQPNGSGAVPLPAGI